MKHHKSNSLKSNEITIKYNINKSKTKIKIFGVNFVEKNKSFCKIVYKGKEYPLTKDFIIDQNENNNFLEIKLIGIENITDISYIFSNCDDLFDISYFDTKNIINMSHLFSGCKLKKYLPDISYWNTSNVIDMNNMFSGCKSLISLPDISKWDISKVKNMEYMFYKCESLIVLPDISKWNTSNVLNMNSMFAQCKSLNILPDISKWDLNKIRDINNIFCNCSSIVNLPDISNWKNFELIKRSYDIILGCISLSIALFLSYSQNTSNCCNYIRPKEIKNENEFDYLMAEIEEEDSLSDSNDSNNNSIISYSDDSDGSNNNSIIAYSDDSGEN